MAENIYENVQKPQPCGIAVKEPALSPPSKRITFITTLLAILLLVLAILLIALTILYFQKEKKLQELEEVSRKYSISFHLCNVFYASLEESHSSQLSQNVSGGFSEIQDCLENVITSQTSLQERYRKLLRLVSTGWKFYNRSFYFFSKEAKPWWEAEQACVSQGVHLTSVSSKEEMEFLVTENAGNSFWIGLNDQREEGNWIWTDGTKYNHRVSFWEQGQPDNWNQSADQQEDCVHFRNKVLLSWNDMSCGTAQRWICKEVFS